MTRVCTSFDTSIRLIIPNRGGGPEGDREWLELERALRNTFNLTPESLLLDISPASVTKARQRLKAKV